MHLLGLWVSPVMESWQRQGPQEHGASGKGAVELRKSESTGVVKQHCCHGTWGVHPGGQPGHVLAARLLETFLLSSPMVVPAHRFSGLVRASRGVQGLQGVPEPQGTTGLLGQENGLQQQPWCSVRLWGYTLNLQL